nr:IS1380 family transposase [Phycisphaerae bacterium]
MEVSSDAGLFSFRDLDEAAQLTESGAAELFDFRTGSNIRHAMTALLRQSIYSRLAGYEDINDAERLRADPVMRHVVGGRAVDRDAASTSQVARFETDVLCHPDNLDALMAMSGQWVDRIRQRRPTDRLILDMDSSVSPTYGEQEGTAYNGHFGCECYHPLFLFNQDGDLERALLRSGNVASADDWLAVLEPVIARYRNLGIPKYFRGDAAFALPELYALLEGETYGYAIRLKSNAVLERQIEHLLTRPVGRPPKQPQRVYHSSVYRAESWDRARRVVAKIEWHPGELFPQVGFIVTNLTGSPKSVVRFLQPAWDRRAVDQRRQMRRALDPPVLSQLRGQPGSPATARPGLQPRQLPQAIGPAASRETLDSHNATRQAGQDRLQDRVPRSICDVPVGGS